ncbi:hypothetical protein T492DRAFT_868385 [Pavlovales sp. CCMP2436]|nr:hypothetical protein T492DRAFT_868385 [Pavlovales sp. CCMP2436]
MLLLGAASRAIAHLCAHRNASAVRLAALTGLDVAGWYERVVGERVRALLAKPPPGLERALRVYVRPASLLSTSGDKGGFKPR